MSFCKILTIFSPLLAETHTDSGELVAVNQFSIFIIGAGGFGGKREAPNLKVCVCVCVKHVAYTSCYSTK